MAARARRLVEKADEGKSVVVIAPVVLAEAFYTLESYYKIRRAVVAEKLAAFIESRGIETMERDRLLDALNRCRSLNAHFADAYLAATGAELRLDIVSFDKDFNKFKDIRRLEP